MRYYDRTQDGSLTEFRTPLWIQLDWSLRSRRLMRPEDGTVGSARPARGASRTAVAIIALGGAVTLTVMLAMLEVHVSP